MNRMRLKRILLPILCLVGVGLLAFTAAHAQFGLDQAAPPALKGNKDLLGTISNLIKTLLSYLGVLFLILMLYAGFLYMTAQGDDKKIGTAKKIITSAVTGLIIIAASYAIVSFILAAVTGAAKPSSGTTETPIPGSTSDAGQCDERSCRTATDCNVPGNQCYTGACECVGEGDPATGSTGNPCSFGFCRRAL